MLAADWVRVRLGEAVVVLVGDWEREPLPLGDMLPVQVTPEVSAEGLTEAEAQRVLDRAWV